MIQTIPMLDLRLAHIVMRIRRSHLTPCAKLLPLVTRRGARLVKRHFTGSKLGAEKGSLVYYLSGAEGLLMTCGRNASEQKAIVDIGQRRRHHHQDRTPTW